MNSYISLVKNVMDGGQSKASAGSTKAVALIILIIGVAGVALMMASMTPPKVETTSYVLYTSVDQESEGEAFIRGFIQGSIYAGAAAALMVFSLFMYSQMNGGAGVPESIVSVSLFLFPVILGSVLNYMINIIARETGLGSIGYFTSTAIQVIVGVSAVVFLYNATKCVMGLKARVCYFATIIAIFGFGAGFGVTQSLI